MATMSKRAQARTEKELQDLLKVSGNSVCADCGARNPSWASWSIGVFLCMRCASLHRKLGTHISKVKSLSMDTWTNDQVENMRKNGNTAVNKVYNPRNKKPDMPFDADEVDSAMERFIRKKYQEKSLSDGKPEVPSRDEPAALRSRSPENSPPPALPSKKGRFFGFGLRASSSAYPLSKHDKKHRNEPRVDSAFRITSEDYTSATRTAGSRADVRAEMSDFDVQTKLGQLRDMGFTDAERNTNILRRLNGDVERTIEALVKLGPGEKTSSRRNTPEPSSTKSTTSTAAPPASQASASRSNNPFDQLDKPTQPTAFGLSMGNPQQQQLQQQQQSPSMSTNPWQTAVPNAVTGIEQSFSNMQVSQQQPQGLFLTQNMPQQDSRLQTMTPPAPSVHQQYGMSGSPNMSNNPFVPLSAHSTGSNPWAAQTAGVPSFAPSTNPFLPSQPIAQQSPSSLVGHNPFGLPPSNSPPQNRSLDMAVQYQQYPLQNPMQQPQGLQQYAHPFQMDNAMLVQPQQYRTTSPAQYSPGLPNFQYGQPQVQQNQQFQHQQQNLQQQQQQQPQQQYNPFFQQQQSQQPQQLYQQPQQQQYQPQSQFQSQPPQLVPQQTGRYDKNSILALYGAPQQPLASIPEPGEDQQLFSNQPHQPQQQYQQQQQPLSPAPTNPYSSNLNSAKRASTLPSSFMPSSSMNNPMNGANSILSRNPFMTSPAADNNNNLNMNATRSVSGIPPTQFSHSSAESISVNNATLMDGRHSPDAFASLSARYMR